jgi:hypothetical protein
LAKKHKNLSQEQVKMRILAYLYNRGKFGANQYVIQHKANIPSQDGRRFKDFLKELCLESCLDTKEEETGGDIDKVRISYLITQKGRMIVEQYRNSLLPTVFGSIEDLFDRRD